MEVMQIGQPDAHTLVIQVEGANLEECINNATLIADTFFEGVRYSLGSVWAEVDKVVETMEGTPHIIDFKANFEARAIPAAAGDTPPVA
jgi:hypothetical protein